MKQDEWEPNAGVRLRHPGLPDQVSIDPSLALVSLQLASLGRCLMEALLPVLILLYLYPFTSANMLNVSMCAANS